VYLVVQTQYKHQPTGNEHDSRIDPRNDSLRPEYQSPLEGEGLSLYAQIGAIKNFTD
jgi:hypothetical protein